MEFYADEASLVDAVVGFVAPALAEGVAVVVATAAHREAVNAALSTLGVDADGAVASGHLVLLDAQQTLDAISVDGTPDAAAFQAVVGGALEDAGRRGGPVQVYGEMVALLWERGHVHDALVLEQLWNDAASTVPFALLCGYPSVLFGEARSAAGFEQICDQHAAVTVPPDEELTRFASVGNGSRERDVRWRLPADLTSGARARDRLRELLAAWDLEHLIDDAELLTTELVNNAVVHARSRVLVRVTQQAHALRVAVTDHGGGALYRMRPGLSDTHGRGLLLVEAISASWGTATNDGSKTVWFELAHRQRGL